MTAPLPLVPNDQTVPVLENRESFFARVRPWMAPSEILDVEFAYMMAKFGHRAQVRKELDTQGHPVRYFEHVRRVAIILIDELKCRDHEMICAAILHDTLEDTKDISAQMLEHLFGKEVVKMVKLLSKVPKEGYYERLLDLGNEKIWAIKGCDRTDNLRSLKAGSIEFQKRQIEDTRRHVYPMLYKLREHNVGTGNYLFQQIDAMVESFLVSF
jgi:(p)ppGpp synthase/HD superfamily hydrolase